MGIKIGFMIKINLHKTDFWYGIKKAQKNFPSNGLVPALRKEYYFSQQTQAE